MSTPLTHLPGITVEVRGLKKSYRGETALHGVDLAVKSGELFVIMGPSGGGKACACVISLAWKPRMPGRSA